MALTTGASIVSTPAVMSEQRQQHAVMPGGGGGVPHQKDTTFTKIFVGGLPYHTTDQTLRSFFEPFGDILEAVVITDRQTGKSRGYGFVTMMDEASAQRACKDPNPIIDGRKANVNLAYLGAKPRLPVGELIAAASFPYGLKSSGLTAVYPVGEFFGLPQLIYQSPNAAAAFLQPSSVGGCNPAALTMAGAHHQPSNAHSAISAAALAAAVGGHPAFIDYQLAAAYQPAAAGPGGTHLTGFEAFQAAALQAAPPTTCPFGPAGFLTASGPSGAGFGPFQYAIAGGGGSPGGPGGAGGGVPTTLPIGGHQFAHFRPLQIQDRM